MRFVYPNSLLNPRAVDEFFADEAAAIDGPRVALWDASEGRLLDRRLPMAGEVLVYRGWILAREGYARLADEITAAGGTTFVSAEQYARAQFLDGWIDTMDGLTPRSSIAALGASTGDLVAQVATELEGKRFVVKGLSKSAKDAWDDAMFIRDVTDLPRVVDNLRPLLGEEETGLVIREFVPLLRDELRAWWVDGRCVAVRNHPQSRVDALDTMGVSAFLEAVAERMEALDVSFATTDLTRDTEGRWWVVEVGSGCVSELPAGLTINDLFPPAP